MREIASCLVCGSTARTMLYEGTFRGGGNVAEYFLAHRSKTAHGDIARCKSCGFAYTALQFEPSEYQEIYAQAGARHDGSSELLNAENSRGKRLAKLVNRHVSEGRLLDIGCGHGGFLRAVRGFKNVGIEVTPLPAHQSLDAEVVTGSFIDLCKSEKSLSEPFDVVTAFDVFEHLPDLKNYMQELTSLVRSGGLLFVTVPNIESFSARLWRRHWGLILLEHLWYFSPSTLRRFIEPFGWQLLDRGHLPYDVPLSHLVNRIAQLMRFETAKVNPLLSRVLLPVPVGLMYCVFRKK
jgi:2-polyprenyl-3-methyl-5-hydroxy-6-metoxy-1,4-benzoquinol methylase